MTTEEALDMARYVRKALEVAGPYVDLARTQGQMAEAIVALAKEIEGHAKINRQLAAANARLAKYEKPSRAVSE